ncbi:Uncharacterised protein [Acinetobacter baumannii]|nr:Uncharacterised protein [Acinetobacter baumannii]
MTNQGHRESLLEVHLYLAYYKQDINFLLKFQLLLDFLCQKVEQGRSCPNYRVLSVLQFSHFELHVNATESSVIVDALHQVTVSG